MKKWILKAIVQKTISFLPKSQQLNFFFQKYVTKGVQLSDEYFYDRLEHAKNHINSYRKWTNKYTASSSLELGTGWYPVIPISLYLIGVQHIHTLDISPLMTKERILTTIERILESYNQGTLQEYYIPDTGKLAQLEYLSKHGTALTFEALLQELQMTYLIEDARDTKLPNDSMDLIHSNNTFEHIYPTILKPILSEFNRVLQKKEGIQSHFIDMSDHFAHFDTSITIYNFLKFSTSKWKIIDNAIQPQSRLRIDDYIEMYRSLALPIVDSWYRAGDVEALKTVDIHPDFLKYSLERNAISHCHFITKM